MGVNLLHNIYQKNLFENEKNIVFWEGYLENLNTLDLNVFSEKLSVPVLVPVGSRMFFRGQLRHTNEITVALGADYFAKCSAKQAQVLRDHRIKDAKSKLELLKKERDFLTEQLSFSKQNVFDETGHDIIEVLTEEEDKAWRDQHRDRVRQYKQKKHTNEPPAVEITDEELWNRLDELELQEELENEMSTNDTKRQIIEDIDDMIRDVGNMSKLGKANSEKDSDDDDDEEYDGSDTEAKVDNKIVVNRRESNEEDTTKLNSFKQAQERNVTQSQKEAELVAKLDEMEKREEMEDELNRKDDMMQSEYTSDEYEEDSEDEETDEDDYKIKRKVSFADENDSETLELTFKHSDVKPINIPYNQTRGITKPSDVYEAFPNLFCGETSILKKTKYGSAPVEHKVETSTEEETNNQEELKKDLNINRTILIKDITEKMDHNDNDLFNNGRPVSLFKKRRQQRK